MLLVARHGETAYNSKRRFQGRLPVPLNAVGREQAKLLAATWAAEAGITRLVSSPLTRALETAAFVAAATGLAPEVDSRLAETDCGLWTDRMYDEVIAETPAAYAAFRELDLNFQAPGGQKIQDQLDTAVECVQELRAQSTGTVTAVLTHGNVMRLLAEKLLNQKISHDQMTNTRVLQFD